MCAARRLAEAVTIPQFKLVSDMAAAQEVFATRQRLGEEITGYAHALKTEALAGVPGARAQGNGSGPGDRAEG